MYGVSGNGWMNMQVFHQWFEQIFSQVTERPLLIIYNEHLSHVSILLIEKASEEDITILKLPPHVTDKIQALDDSCFGPLKRAWTELLNERMNVLGPKESISKSAFVDLLSQIWYKGLSECTIICRFRATGIFPTNRDKYDIKHFDQQLCNYYQHQIELGRPEDFNAENETSNETDNEQRNEEIEEENLGNPATSSTFVEKEDLVNCCDICKKIGPKPPAIPGERWVIRLALIDTPNEVVEKIFEEVILEAHHMRFHPLILPLEGNIHPGAKLPLSMKKFL